MRIDLDKYKQAPAATPVRGVASNGAISTETALKLVVDKITTCETVHWYSYADWSMHQLLTALLGITGPADVMISSYAFSETPTRIIAGLKNQCQINRLDCLIDSRVETRTAGSLQLLKGICNGLRLISTHAKVTLIRGNTMKVSVVGSANFTENKRYEAGIITTNPEVFSFHETWFKKELYGTD